MDQVSIAWGLASVAPKIVGWLKGPKAEAAAESLVGMAKQITGREDAADALAAIQADPQLALQFNIAVMQHEEKMDGTYLEDRQDARRRDVELMKLGRTNDRANWMIIGDVVGLIACLAILFYLPSEAPGEIRGIVSTIAGFFGLGLRDAHQFEFGSSRGSKDKDARNTLNNVEGR